MKKLIIEEAPKEDEIKKEFNRPIKMDFEMVNDVVNTLNYAFHPEGLPNDEEMNGPDGPDMRFIAMITLFFYSAGWTEAEYWTELRKQESEHVCENCQVEEQKKILKNQN